MRMVVSGGDFVAAAAGDVRRRSRRKRSEDQAGVAGG
jgi:hypothetical protein